MIYLDHAASTGVDPRVAARWLEITQLGGNPNSLHGAGRAARRIVEESREQLAPLAGARPSEILFTSGGTEANNLAIKGLFWARRSADYARNRIIASAVEHHAVLDPIYWLAEHDGADVSLIPVDRAGRIDLDALAELIDEDPAAVALITCMWANNEVGTLQPVDEVVKLAARHAIPVHTDAVQAFGAVPFSFGASGLTAATVTAHKLGGPVGVGALILARGAEVVPVSHGGGQERGVRSGTVDAAGAAAFALAAQLAVDTREEYAARVESLRGQLVAGIADLAPDAVVAGPTDPAQRLPSIANVAFPGTSSETVTMLLDAAGIACSTGSACQAGVAQASHVLMAMGRSEAEALSAVRFSLGRSTTSDEVDTVLAALPAALERARAAGAVA